MTPEELGRRFTFHPATTDERRTAHEEVRAVCRELAEYLNRTLPDGRERSLAITRVEEAMFWANASLARSAS